MTARRHAVLLFSKVPEAGKVKTRLTPIKDGWLTPETAAVLYHCMLFDVVAIVSDALADLEALHPDDEYALFISSPGERQRSAMQELFEPLSAWPRPIEFISDEGANFDIHYNHAFSQVFERGFDTVLSMGCDMPALRRSIVVEGLERLRGLLDADGGGIVVAPDQEMGVSMVGWTRETDFSHDGVYYCQSGLTVLPAYIQKAAQKGLPALYLPDVPDVDTMADLNHNVTLVQALEYCAQFQDDVTAPVNTARAFREMGYTDIRVMPNDLFDDRSEIDK